MEKFKDVGITRNSDLLEAGVDEFAHMTEKKPKKKEKKEKKEKK